MLGLKVFGLPPGLTTAPPGSLYCHWPLKETGAIRQNELVNLTLLLLKEKQSFGDQLRFAMRGIRVK